MRYEPVKIMYGEKAAQVSVTLPDGSVHNQWYCTKCKRIWGENDQHMASWCCCTHKICKCGKEHERYYTRCDDCQTKLEHERWYSKPEVEWNGEWPLSVADGDTYFFDSDDLLDYIDENYEEGTSIEDVADSIRMTSCSENSPRTFEVHEWLSGYLADDQEIANSDSIDERINLILAEIGVVSYSAESVRLNVRQILKAIGYGE